MTGEQFLAEVPIAWEKRETAVAIKWALVWFENGLKFVPATLASKFELCFGFFTEYQMEKGLTGQEWRRLAEKIHRFLFQKGLL